MNINTDCDTFVPTDFLILKFYGNDTCFAWNENKFICFSYMYQDATAKLKVIKAPGKIKDFRSFNNRVFVLCYPSGIYKLTENLEFGTLTKTGIEFCSQFFEVLTPINGLLVLEDKKYKCIQKLFPMSGISDLHTLLIDFNRTNEILFKTLTDHGNSNYVCVIKEDKNLYVKTEEIVKIIYKCENVIKKIHSVEKDEKLQAIILQTDVEYIIFIHAKDNELKCEKIFLDAKATDICAIIKTNIVDELIFIYANDVNTYCCKKNLTNNSICKSIIKGDNLKFKFFLSKYVIFLNSTKVLLQIPIEKINFGSNQSVENLIKLELNMFYNLDETVEAICNKTKKLKYLREEMAKKVDTLQRINAFNNKEYLCYCPLENVHRFFNQMYLISNFKQILPKNTVVIKMLKNRGKSIFTMKNVSNDGDTIIEMPITISNLSSKLYTNTDLITYKNEGGIWCLIKNYIRDPQPNKNNKVVLGAEKLKSVKYYLTVLQNMILNNEEITIEKLSKLKTQFRNEII